MIDIKDIETVLVNEGFKVTPGTIDINGIEQPKLEVLIELEGRESDNGLALDILFVPGIDNELEGCKILQLFVVCADTVEDYNADRIERLSHLIHGFNFNLPLGAFGIAPSDQMLYYKHMLMMPSEMTPEVETTLTETVWLVNFLQNQCYPVIETILLEEIA